jgi:hypothetical protein
MKKYQLSLFISFCLLIASSCSVKVFPVQKNLPPGQAKKITGSKSARAYAPGQQKN